MRKLHVKKYSKELFKDNQLNFESRSKALEALGGKFLCLKKHNFYERGNHIELVTEYIEKKLWETGTHLLAPLTVLANELDKINVLIPHGDIVKKNILWNGHYFVLVDWEPLLEYGTYPTIFYKSTKPYISTFDVKNSKITSNTDKIAFFYFCRKQFYGWFPTDLSELIKLENDLISLEFDEIPDFALSFTS
jgi:hypothetical protein